MPEGGGGGEGGGEGRGSCRSESLSVEQADQIFYEVFHLRRFIAFLEG